DARVNDVDDPAGWTGFHRLEKALWDDRSLVGMAPIADKLDGYRRPAQGADPEGRRAGRAAVPGRRAGDRVSGEATPASAGTPASPDKSGNAPALAAPTATAPTPTAPTAPAPTAP